MTHDPQSPDRLFASKADLRLALRGLGLGRSAADRLLADGWRGLAKDDPEPPAAPVLSTFTRGDHPMATDILSMRQERGRLIAEARTLNDASGTEPMAPEAQRRFDALMERQEELRGRIEREEGLRDLEREMHSPIEPRSATALQPGARMTPEAVREMRAMLQGEHRAMSGGSGPTGGYAVPEEIHRTILDQTRDVSPMRKLASVFTSTSGEFSLLVADRATSSGWVSEDQTRTETNSAGFQKVSPPGGEVYALVLATNHLLFDASFDVEQWLAQNVASEFAAKEGTAFISGDGVSKPFGFLTATQSTASDDARASDALQTVGTATAASVAGDDLHSLVAALRPSLRQNAAWLMNSATAAALRKLKSGDGQYLWTEGGLIEGTPDRLLGYRVSIAEDMPAIGASATPVAFGNWQRGYAIVDVGGLSLVRDPYTQPGWTRFYFARRVLGSVYDHHAIKLLAT